MEVIVGTYNHVLFGFSFRLEEKDDKKLWQFGPLFTDQGHAGCIKSVSSNGRYLSSGSTDETIRLFDLKKHVEVGTLMEQSGTITCLVFCGTTHMLSGSEDGTILIWKTKSWELLKKLKGHRGAINSLSVHPSGRLVLSIAKDKCIRTWNMLTGRTAFTTSIKEVGDLVRWSPAGDCYAIVVGCKITFYQISGVDDPVVYHCDKCILAFEFLSDNEVVLAGEMDDIIFYNFKKKIVLQRLPAHKLRTKALCFAENPFIANEYVMFTTSSDGNLKAWAVDKDLEKEVMLLAELDMPGRPTCMTLKVPPELKEIQKEIAKESNEVMDEEVLESDEENSSAENDEEEISEDEKELSEEEKELSEEDKELSEEEISEDEKELSEEEKELSEDEKDISEDEKDISEDEKQISEDEKETSEDERMSEEEIKIEPPKVERKKLKAIKKKSIGKDTSNQAKKGKKKKKAVAD